MMIMRVIASTAIVAIVIAYAGLSGRWVATGGSWYQSLEQPAWQPPPVVFGLIWPYNFLALIVVGIIVSLNASPAKTIIFISALAVSVVLALTWAYQFYVPHNLEIAAIALTACALVTLPLVAVAFSERIWLGVVLIPSQIWLFVAASLSWGYVANRS
jgi:benzodiazapine receptor